MSGWTDQEERLRSLLREAPVPGVVEAERRGLAALQAACAERRQPRRSTPSLPRLAIVASIVALLGALMLSPAGASVRGWVGGVFAVGVPAAEPGLSALPGGGRLLVQARSGAWVVKPDGSRRLLGEYEEATWSPHGLFVAVAKGRELTAVEPDGTPRWTLSAAGRVADPRWAPGGMRIAYRSGTELRVTAADGSDDHVIASRVKRLAPAWAPDGIDRLAYVDPGGRLRVVDADSGRDLVSASALSGIERLEWGGSGLLEASRKALRIRPVEVVSGAAKPSGGKALRLGPAVDLQLPRGAVLRSAALAADGGTVAASVVTQGPAGSRGTVLLFATHGDGVRRLLSVPGPLGELAWSPGDDRLLVTWPATDQWLFMSLGRARGRAIADIAAAFAPGGSSRSFPRLDGWCCSATR